MQFYYIFTMLSWPEAFVGGVAIVTIAKVLVTLKQSGLSKGVRQPTLEEIKALTLSIKEINDNHNKIMLLVTQMNGLIDRLSREKDELFRRFQEDHYTIKLVYTTMVAWGKMDGLAEIQNRKPPV